MIGLFAVAAALGFGAQMYLKDGTIDKAKNLQVENLPAEFQEAFKEFETRLTQTEGRLDDISKLEEHVKITELKVIEAEAKLKMAEAQLSTAGHKLQYTENKIKDIERKVESPVAIKAIEQNNELARVNDEIRKEVKRQIKSIEQQD